MEETKDLAVQQMQPTSKSSVFLDTNRFEQVQRACRALTQSDLVPDMYRTTAKNPENKAIANCMIALDMADRMGANPLMVMQNMYIVYGRPAWSSAFLIATVNSCGRFKPLKFKHGQEGEIEVNGQRMPNLTCYAYTSEKNDDAELVGSTISLAMAKAEGWLTKNGSKWMTMPQQMLIYRSAAFWVRTYAPEISMGIYTAEENEDIQAAQVISTRLTNTPRQVVDVEDEEEPQASSPSPTAEQPAQASPASQVDDDCGY